MQLANLSKDVLKHHLKIVGIPRLDGTPPTVYLEAETGSM
jgi:hypothetical protein